MDHGPYRTGTFARMTAVSVRTLRFYDRIGLLIPAGRTDSGYRLYGNDDLVRLQQILALKFLGFTLEEIQRVLGAPAVGLRRTLRQQSAMLRERRRHLDAVIDATERAERSLETEAGEAGDWNALVRVIQAIQMQQDNTWRNKYFTEEQRQVIDRLSRASYSDEARAVLASRPAWTEADQHRVDERYAALYTGVRQAAAGGEDPAGPAAQALAAEAIALIEAFTGGDAGVAEGLQAWWNAYHTLPAEQRPFTVPLSPEESAFLERAKTLYTARRRDAGPS